jgi:hypothetical protein
VFVVVYKFTVKKSFESDFTNCWHEGTLLIREERKSFGSRLHKAGENLFVAYAQWPSRDAWKNFPPSSPQLSIALQKMNLCLESSEIAFELEVSDDLLVK